MKCCVAVFVLGLVVLTISETVSTKDKIDEIDDYLDDTYYAMQTNAKSLNLDPMNLPNISFTVHVPSEDESLLIRATATNLVLTGMASLRGVGDGEIDDREPKIMSSVFRAKDLVINGQLSLLGETYMYNKTCTLFVDIEELGGRFDLDIPVTKTESLSVDYLFVHFYRTAVTVVLEKGCVEEEPVKTAIVVKLYDELFEDLGYNIRRPLKEALNKTLKPFDPESVCNTSNPEPTKNK